jgi:hypothetical protein
VGYRHTWHRVCHRTSVTPREELHRVIDRLYDDQLVPALHAAVDTLPDDLIPDVLARMKAQQQRLPPYPPDLFKN